VKTIPLKNISVWRLENNGIDGRIKKYFYLLMDSLKVQANARNHP